MQLGVKGTMRKILVTTYNQEGIVRCANLLQTIHTRHKNNAIIFQGPVSRHECELLEGHPHDGHLLLCLRVNETADGA